MTEEDLIRAKGIGPIVAARLIKAGIKSIEDLAKAKPENLAFVKGIGTASAKKIIANANYMLTFERGLIIVLEKIQEKFSKSCPKCGGAMKKRFIILDPESRISAAQCSVCKFYLPA